MSLFISAFMHLMLLAVALINFSSTREAVSTQPVAVQILSPSDLSLLKAGTPDQQETAAAPKALPEDKIAEAHVTTPDPKVVQEPSKKQLSLPQPSKMKTAPAQVPTKNDEKPKPAPRERTDAEMTEQEKADAALEPHPELPKPKPKPPTPVQTKPVQKAEPKQSPSRPDRIDGLLKRNSEDQTWRAAQEDHRSEKVARFDPNRISALINRDPTAGQQPSEHGPKQPWRKPASLQEQATGMTPGAQSRSSNGMPAGRDDRMSANEIDAFIAQIGRCWTPPVGGLAAEAMIVRLHIELNEDGTLARPPQVTNNIASPFFTPAADSAVRAVIQCQPYHMPTDKYAMWRDMLLNFDPREMHGG